MVLKTRVYTKDINDVLSSSLRQTVSSILLMLFSVYLKAQAASAHRAESGPLRRCQSEAHCEHLQAVRGLTLGKKKKRRHRGVFTVKKQNKGSTL